MQSPTGGSSSNKTTGRLLGPALGDQQQGSFSINLWKNAFQDAFQKLCPVRAGGHECGCLPIIGKMVFNLPICLPFICMFSFEVCILQTWHLVSNLGNFPAFVNISAECNPLWPSSSSFLWYNFEINS